MAVIDSHCHLDSPEFDSGSGGCDAVVARARAAGVYRMLSAATSQKDAPHLRRIAETYDDVFISVGVHPHEAAKETATAEDLVLAAAAPKVVAIGEAGLDYFYDFAPRAAQQALFRENIRAACLTGLPLIVHTRDAEDDTLRLLEEGAAAGQGTLRGVIHCFSGSRRLAEAALALGFYVSFSGMLTFKKADAIRAIAKDVPMDRLLVETDAPYLAPVPLRGKVCEPSFVLHTARQLAAVKGVEAERIMETTTDNFFSLFSKVSR